MRRYWCDKCNKLADEVTKVPAKCESCGEVFGTLGKPSGLNINMRTTWSGQTKVEFTHTTMDEDIKQRNNR